MESHLFISQPNLGKRLQDIRIAKGLTQLELRDKSHVSVRTIQRIESGLVTPRVITIKILLKTLDENEEDWFGPKVTVGNQLLIKNWKTMLLLTTEESDLKNAFTPAWVSGIIYLLMVFMEQGVEAFSEYLNGSYFLPYSMVIIKSIAAISFFLFTRGLLSLSLLFENQLLKIGSYLSMTFVAVLYLSESAIILLTEGNMDLVAAFRTFAVIPLGAISVIMGIGLLRLQDGMGRIAKIAGRLELIFGICYMTLIFSFIGVLILMPLLVVEIVMLSKAEQLEKEA